MAVFKQGKKAYTIPSTKKIADQVRMKNTDTSSKGKGKVQSQHVADGNREFKRGYKRIANQGLSVQDSIDKMIAKAIS